MILFDAVTKTFGSGDAGHAALQGVSFEIGAGQVFGVIGRSGAGKSTLVRLINRLERPTAGRVLVDGEDVGALDGAALRTLRRRVGMIFQHFNLLSSKTVAENVAFPLRLAGERNVAGRVAELLERVGLADQARKYPAQLSGGQKQRVGIARALATGPKVLLCDEATSALDPETTEQVLNLLWDINRELGLTIVMITHEMDVVRRVCHRVAVLEAGRLAEIGHVTDVFLHPRTSAAQGLVAEADRSSEPADLARAGSALRLTFVGEVAFEPVLGRVARETGVDYSILSGRIDRIRDMPYGQLVVSLVGGDAAEARRRLEAAGVHVEAAR